MVGLWHTVEGYMSQKENRDYDEKPEKQEEKDEKDRQKQEEKTVEEKWRRDPLSAIVWAVILIWAGLVFLAGNLGLLDWFNELLDTFNLDTVDWPVDFVLIPLEAVSLFFLGAGAIILGEVLIRLLVPAYRKPLMGSIILAVVFLGLGLGSWGCVWPLIIIAIGLSILWRNLFTGQKGGE
jgi:hypothetical protein